MSAATVTVLFLVSFVLLMGLAGAALLIDSANRERARVDGRLAAILPAARSVAAASSVRLPVEQPGGMARLARLIGCDYPRRQHYPVSWWLVPVVAIVPARLSGILAATLIDAASWVVVGVVWVLACRAIYNYWGSRRRDLLLKQFPDALGMIVRTVRVGVPALEGIRMVGREADEPTGAEFRQLVEEVSIGTTLDAALRAAAERTGIAEYRFFATAVALQMQTGGGLSDALEILADVVRKRLALRDRGFALTSEARSSAMVLGVMPFVVAIGLAFASPGYLDPLFSTPFGNKLLAIGVISLCMGIASMRALIRRTLA